MTLQTLLQNSSPPRSELQLKKQAELIAANKKAAAALLQSITKSSCNSKEVVKKIWI